MALPTRDSVQTMDYVVYAEPAVYLEAKSLSSATLDYVEFAEPVYGLPPSAAPAANTNFLLFFNVM